MHTCQSIKHSLIQGQTVLFAKLVEHVGLDFLVIHPSLINPNPDVQPPVLQFNTIAQF